MVNNRTRDGMKGSSCSKSYNFFFEWSLESRKLPPSDAIIRVYMQSLDRRLVTSPGSVMAVNVSSKLRVTHSMDDSESEDDDSPHLWTFLRSINVESNTSGWLEFNVKKQLVNLWNPETKHAIVSVTLRFDVDCELKEKVPMKLINPVTLSLNKPRRSKLSVFQPFLVISTVDNHIKTVIARNVLMISSDEPTILSEEQSERRKRQTQEHICRIEDFIVTFSDLGITNILLPLTLNVRQCSGSCSINYAPNTVSLTTNHARLMTSATNVHKNHMPILNPSPKDPCCSPVGYHPAYLMIGYPRSVSIEVKLYSEFIVRDCGCR